MATFIVYFKTGAKVAVNANGWHLDSSNRLIFETVENDKTKFIWINTSELLYVVPAALVAPLPNSIH